MCGRFVVRELKRAARLLRIPIADYIQTRFNLAPTQNAPILYAFPSGGANLVEARWGLIPPGAKEVPKYATFNARVETVETKPAFLAAWRAGQRCIVPASGIYEWKDTPEGKQPFYITRKDGEELLLAGLWQSDTLSGRERTSFTILVGPPNRLVAQIHDRQAIMLDDQGVSDWMHPRQRPDDQWKAILRPCPEADLIAWPVSREVNSSRAEGPQLIEAVGQAIEG